MNNSEDSPFVSVALMTYNRAHYLRGVLDSWLAQTYTNFELIISDDASTDDTQKICEEYVKKDKRIRYIRQPKNLNAPGCYKAILREARGKYFIWASDDDLWDKHFLEECIDVYREHPEYIMVFADMVYINKKGEVIEKYNPTDYMPFSKNTYERLKTYTLLYFCKGKTQLIFGLWKREVLLDDPLFGFRAKDDRFPYYWGFDPFLIFRDIGKGPIGFIDKVLFYRRSRWKDPEYIVVKHRSFLPRIAVTFYHRLGKVFGSPYFWHNMRCVIGNKNLSSFEKVKLIFWIFFVMARIFFVRKI